MIAHGNFNAILIPDPAITTTSGLMERVLSQFKAYIENGGLVIVGLNFTRYATRPEFNNFFQAFDLPWAAGLYNRTAVQFLPSCTVPASLNALLLPGPYEVKALRLQNTRPHEKFFVPNRGQTETFGPFLPERLEELQPAVAGARIGNGDLVYCGDMEYEDESFALIMALCGSQS
ncbi:hypothetical protein N7540_011848 [Penicillium herquei]|nr:hypothetical protein N7540_011848 [Penicillium herquei]